MCFRGGAICYYSIEFLGNYGMLWQDVNIMQHYESTLLLFNFDWVYMHNLFGYYDVDLL